MLNTNYCSYQYENELFKVFWFYWIFQYRFAKHRSNSRKTSSNAKQTTKRKMNRKKYNLSIKLTYNDANKAFFFLSIEIIMAFYFILPTNQMVLQRYHVWINHAIDTINVRFLLKFKNDMNGVKQKWSEANTLTNNEGMTLWPVHINFTF